MESFNMESAGIVISVTAAAMYVLFRVKDALSQALGRHRNGFGCASAGCSVRGCGARPRKSQLK